MAYQHQLSIIWCADEIAHLFHYPHYIAEYARCQVNNIHNIIHEILCILPIDYSRSFVYDVITRAEQKKTVKTPAAR